MVKLKITSSTSSDHTSRGLESTLFLNKMKCGIGGGGGGGRVQHPVLYAAAWFRG